MPAPLSPPVSCSIRGSRGRDGHSPYDYPKSRLRIRALSLLALCLTFGSSATAQSTLGLIAGRVTDARTGRGLEAKVVVTNSSNSVSVTGYSETSGVFSIPALPPGEYTLRIEVKSYQVIEIEKVELPVAGHLNVPARLRPLADVWNAGRFQGPALPGTDAIVKFFGPDVDERKSGVFQPNAVLTGALETTISDVIDPRRLRDLPLAGRDTFTLLAAQPGVTSDGATARGLGLAAHGQRPSSANFLVDGIETNNMLVSGPLTALAPEAIAEYRISTANYSPEFGRTAGFVANVVTRRGGEAWHGLGYANFRHGALNANTFQRNRRGLERSPFEEQQAGFQIGGPLVARRLFLSAALDGLRSRGFGEESTVRLPSDSFGLFASGLSRKLYDDFPAIVRPRATGPTAIAEVRPTASIDRTTGVLRLDAASRFGRWSGRYLTTRIGVPDFIWTPYPDFVSGLNQPSHSIGGTLESSLSPRLSNEARLAFSRDSTGWQRARPDIPTLAEAATGTVLPGSPAFFGFRNRSRGIEAANNVTYAAAGHVWKAGAAMFARTIDGELTAGRDGLFVFQDILDYGTSRPTTVSVAVDRGPLPRLRTPDYARRWTSRQFALFAQDTWLASERWTLNYGVRYDSFGAPVDRRAGGSQPLYAADRNDLQIRFGATYAPRASSRWLARAAYGVFQDRLFDNLWQSTRNNQWTLPTFLVRAPIDGYDFSGPVANKLASFEGQPVNTQFPAVTRIEARLRSPYVQAVMIGGTASLGGGWSAEVNATGQFGRKLMTSDWLNRGSTAEYIARNSQGSSNYFGLETRARWRHSRGFLQAAYTWSHAIDNQSDPLQGDFFDLSFTRVTETVAQRPRAQFLRPGDSRGDRGSADFDQRHNLVVISVWEWRGFRFSQVAAARSGFPFSVTAGTLNRANVLGPATLASAVTGGTLVLDRAAFRVPAAGTFGNSGRNAFAGPGQYNADVSLARDFRLREGMRLTARIDAYNVLNHANLAMPDSELLSPTFGVALRGRRGRDTGFPAQRPFIERARELQLMLRVEF